MQEKVRAIRDGQQIARVQTNKCLINFFLGAFVFPRGRTSVAFSDSSSAALHISMSSWGVACVQKEIMSVALPVLQGITWLQIAIW